MTDRPSKLYFTISEVATLTGVKPHVLRYWESEFPTLRPRKTKSGSRRYRQPDIDEILAIKSLLYDEGFRISGARKIRRQAHLTTQTEGKTGVPQLQIPMGEMDPREQIAYIKSEISHIVHLIKELGHESTAVAKSAANGAEEAPDAGESNKPDEPDEPLKEMEAKA